MSKNQVREILNRMAALQQGSGLEMGGAAKGSVCVRKKRVTPTSDKYKVDYLRRCAKFGTPDEAEMAAARRKARKEAKRLAEEELADIESQVGSGCMSCPTCGGAYVGGAYVGGGPKGKAAAARNPWLSFLRDFTAEYGSQFVGRRPALLKAASAEYRSIFK